MTAVFTKTSLILLALFAGLVGLIRAQPHDDNQLGAILRPPSGCPMPCFLGIRPGVTTVDEAVAILEAQPWAADITLAGGFETGSQYGSITWRWDGQPVSNGEEYGGELRVIRDVVHTMTLRTPMTFGDIWLLSDRPEEGLFIYIGQLRQPPPRYLIEYYLGDLTVRTVVSCRSFWQQQALIFVNFMGGSEYLLPYNLLGARRRSCEESK
jgi:hypothetical protein